MSSEMFQVAKLDAGFSATLFFLAFVLAADFSVSAAVVEGVALSKSSNSNLCANTCDEDAILLVRHRGRHHGWRGGHGSGGVGVCPQPRSTPDAPENFLKMINPLKQTQSNILAGKEILQFEAQPTACQVCHGAIGNGLGPMAIGLVPLPRNFTCGETMKHISDGQMFYIITHGSQGSIMPAYRNLSDEQVWQLITFIRTLTKK